MGLSDMMDLEELQAKQDENDKKNRMMNSLAAIADNHASSQGIGNFYLRMLNPESTFARDLVKKNQAQDPMERQQKAMAYLKQKNEADKLKSQGTADSADSLAAQAAYRKLGLDVSPTDTHASLNERYGPFADLNKMSMQERAKARDRIASQNFEREKLGLQAGYSQSELAAKLASDKELAELRAKNDLNKLDAEGKQRMAELERKSAVPMMGAMTEGRKAADKDFAKQYNEWTANGRSTVDKNLARLRQAAEALAADDSLSGPIRSMAPDAVRAITNPKAIVTRDDVRAAAQGALKATLGAQFTEKEGERIMNMAYNEKLSPQENINKINAAIAELESNKRAMDSRSKYFEDRGTLTGWSGANESPIAQGGQGGQKAIVKTQTNKATGEKRIVYSDGSTEIIPRTAGN